MAPRGRGRPRKGNTRMDAALDAMRPFGFEDAMVKATVEELLEVYTYEGWIFIEEYSYKLLIDTLLGKQNGCTHKEGDTMPESSAGPSNLLALPSSPDALDASDKVPELIEAPEAVHLVASLPLNSSPPTHEIGTQRVEARNPEAGDQSPPPPCSTRPYRPTYGWISECGDQDPEDDIIELPKMSIEEFKKQYYFRMGIHVKKRSRWDVPP